MAFIKDRKKKLEKGGSPQKFAWKKFLMAKIGVIDAEVA